MGAILNIRALLLAGAVYLCLVGTAHFVAYKVPVLYIYYDIPSTVYQDRVIGTLCYALAVLLAGFSRIVSVHPGAARYAVLSGVAILLGFGLNTLFSPEVAHHHLSYWAQILGLAVYVGLLAAASHAERRTRV